MVKIKEGYVMSPGEKQEFERQEALPRKTWGRVDYYFKPVTKYPARIYVFMQAELWCDRNRRPMGLFHALPFLSRPMNKEELEYHHFNWRLCYHQYEDWGKLLYAEEKEAGLLDLETPGSGTEFLLKLAAFRERYPLSGQQAAPIIKTVEPKATEIFDLTADEEIVLSYLVRRGNLLEALVVSKALGEERAGQNRKPVLIALTRLYQDFTEDAAKIKPLTIEWIRRKAEISCLRTRRNFVRRIYKTGGLFAMQQIISRYPGYTEELLLADLRRKPGKTKRKKHKPIVDLRRCQLQKLAARLRNGNLCEKEYHDTCCKMASLGQAHLQHAPIRLTVKLKSDTLVYPFDWKIRESVVKSFVDMANTDGMTHPQLESRYQEIVRSRNSF